VIGLDLDPPLSKRVQIHIHLLLSQRTVQKVDSEQYSIFHAIAVPLAMLAINVVQKQSVDPNAFRLKTQFPQFMFIWAGSMVVGKGGLFLINSTLVLWIESHRSTCLIVI